MAGPDADGQADMEEGGDEIDPLDAFMAENDGAAAAAIGAAQQAAPDEEEDVDPLDAFMAAEVLPSVKQEPGVPAAPGVKEQPPAVPKAEAPAALPVGVKLEAANGVAADGAGPIDKAAVVKRRARRRYADSDESSDDEPESASEDDEVRVLQSSDVSASARSVLSCSCDVLSLPRRDDCSRSSGWWSSCCMTCRRRSGHGTCGPAKPARATSWAQWTTRR